MKVAQMPPVHAANLVAKSGNTAYGVDVINQFGFTSSHDFIFYPFPHTDLISKGNIAANLVNMIAADSLVHCITRPSATMNLILLNKIASIVHGNVVAPTSLWGSPAVFEKQHRHISFCQPL